MGLRSPDTHLFADWGPLVADGPDGHSAELPLADCPGRRDGLGGWRLYGEDNVPAEGNVVIVANLKPAKLMGIESNGMVLAASPDGGKPNLIGFEQPPAPGTRVR